MATFELSCVVAVSASTVVEADPVEEAIAIAESRLVVIAGRGENDSESWVIDEADGEPAEIRVDRNGEKNGR